MINGTLTDMPIPRDYDGDGITDMAVFRPGAAAGQQAWWYYRSTRNGFVQVSIPWGTTGDGTNTLDIPAPGDYDGDGKCDVAVYRVGLTPANNFIVRKSSDGSTLYQQWGDFQFDWIVPGDYDGDGKCDFAIARITATATDPMYWNILRSSDGGRTEKLWGLSADVPVQGDYDGDARTDIAIYRRGASTSAQSFFWVVNSLSGTGTATPWGLGSVAAGQPPYPNYFTDYPLADYDAR
jgi:spore coat protein A, manganese oxidase